MAEEIKATSKLKSLKKSLLVIILLIVGVFLTLSGKSLIEISPELLFYSGIGLIVTAILYYIIY